MSARRLLSLLCLGACAAALAGCGDTLSLDPVANAASNTAETQSARIAFAATIDAAGMGRMSMEGSGLYDGRAKSGWMFMKFRDLPAAAQAQLGANPSMEIIFDASDGIVMYMRSSAFSQLAGDRWVKMDLEKMADKMGVDLGSLGSANQADPSQALGLLMASDHAKVTGSEVVRGARTTRYSLHIDVRELAEDAGELGESLEKMLETTGLDSIPAEAWIDEQNRIRRLKFRMSMNSPMGGSFSMTMTEELYDFGVRANINPPADADVLDLSSFLGN
jgi:hypothetical protein